MTSLVYLDGTASVSTGSALVTGHGTAWKIALVEGGSFSLAGLSVPILSVDSDTSLTLAYDWPGDTLEEARYAIARETSQAIRAAWINDRLAQFHQKPWGIGVLPDGRGTLAERNALNPMPFDNYCWLRVEVDQPAELYFKVPAGWLGPFRLSGEVGPVGPAGVLRWRTEGWNNTASYQVNDGLAHNGTSYRAYVDHVATAANEPGVGANWADFWQVTAQGTILIEGTTTTLPPDQPARVEFRPVPGGYAVDFFVPRGPTGDIDGLTPFWQTRVSTDMNATEAQTGLGATATGRALFTAANAGVAVRTLGLAGEVVMLPGATIPSGRRLLKLNGASLSRTTYADLWAYAQASGILAASEGAKTPAQFGPGNGSSTFTLPDWRGYFIRALDDGRGIDVGRVISAIQAQATEQHQHELPFGFDGSVTWPAIFDPSIGVPIYGSTTGSRPRTQGTHPGAATTGATRIAYSSTAVERSGETRPINLAALFAIRF